VADASTRQTIVALLRDRFPELVLIVLFGSEARGDATLESDLDVAVLGGRPLPRPRVAQARSDLEVATGRDVHLVDLRTADTVLQHQVMQTGETLYTSGGRGVEGFLDFVLRDYVRLNEARAGILDDIRSRGRIHGR
jgi:uncharacterized protein